MPTFLHGLNDVKLKLKHFQRTQEGTTGGGVRLQRIESFHPAVHAAYKHGILVEPPGKKEMIAFGSYQDILDITKQLEVDPDAVYRDLRQVTPSKGGMFYVNKPAPETQTVEMTPEEMDQKSIAHKLYPKQGDDTRPRTRKQERSKEMLDHVNSVIQSKNPYPTSTTEGKEWKQDHTPGKQTEPVTLVSPDPDPDPAPAPAPAQGEPNAQAA